MPSKKKEKQEGSKFKPFSFPHIPCKPSIHKRQKGELLDGNAHNTLKEN